MVMRQGIVYVVSGPSGAGKTTILEKILQEDRNLTFSVSYTTRKPRVGETDGVQYFFVNQEKFDSLIQEDDFLEYAHVHNYCYGTSKSFVFPLINSGKDVLLDIDVQGALNVKKKLPNGILIFLAPPSLHELSLRLKKRATEKLHDFYKRMEDSKWEMSHIRDFSFLIVNNEVNTAFNQLRTIIEAQRFRTEFQEERVKNFEEEAQNFILEREESTCTN